MNNLLVADSVSKNFGKFTALNNVSIEVPKGSIFGTSMETLFKAVNFPKFQKEASLVC